MHVCAVNCFLVQAEDWEHEFEFADDDQDQGADEVYDDDPGGGVRLCVKRRWEGGMRLRWGRGRPQSGKGICAAGRYALLPGAAHQRARLLHQGAGTQPDHLAPCRTLCRTLAAYVPALYHTGLRKKLGIEGDEEEENDEDEQVGVGARGGEFGM